MLFIYILLLSFPTLTVLLQEILVSFAAVM